MARFICWASAGPCAVPDPGNAENETGIELFRAGCRLIPLSSKAFSYLTSLPFICNGKFDLHCYSKTIPLGSLCEARKAGLRASISRAASQLCCGGGWREQESKQGRKMSADSIGALSGRQLDHALGPKDPGSLCPCCWAAQPILPGAEPRWNFVWRQGSDTKAQNLAAPNLPSVRKRSALD